jgi:hypothetical protein
VTPQEIIEWYEDWHDRVLRVGKLYKRGIIGMTQQNYLSLKLSTEKAAFDIKVRNAE